MSEPKSEDAELETIDTRFELLKKASIDVYTTGISLKLAARKWNVTLADLRYFYNTAAQDYLPFGASEDDSEMSDP